MSQPVDTLLVRVEADLRDVRKSLAQLEKDSKRTADRTSKAFTNIGRGAKVLLGGVLARELAQAGNSAVNFASHVGEMQAKSGVVFGEFTEKVRKDLKSFADEVGRSEFELEEMAASVQDTFVPMGFARGEAADLSVQLAKLATDVGSFNNASDTETMKAFQSALVGNHETVRRFGIVITEAELQAELFRMGIDKAKDEVTAAEKVQARLNLILAGTTDAHGDAARTADSYANKVKNMDAAIQRLQKAIGERLMPIFSGLVDKTTDAANALAEFFNEGNTISQAKTLQEALENVAKAEQALIDNADAYAETATMNHTKAAQTAFALEKEAVALGKVLLAEQARAEEFKRQIKLEEQQAKIDKAEKDEEKSEISKQKGKDFVDAQTDALALLRLELQGATDAQLELTKAEQDGAAFSPEQIATYNAQAEALQRVQRELEGTEIIQDSLKQGFENFGVGVSDAITDMVTGVSSGLDGLKDIVRASISEIISNMIRLHVVNKTINAALGFFGAPESMMLPTAATGGAIQARSPVLVGERGPELIVPKSASTVRNAHDTRLAMSRSGAGVAVYQTINVTTGVQDTVKAEIANLMPQISDASKSAVLDARRRGGSFSRAF